MKTFGWVEVHAVDHCNNNCRWCHNYSPLAVPRTYEASEYFRGLDILQENGVYYQILSIMGGEPFLHPDLVGFAVDLKRRYMKELMVTTNGFWLGDRQIIAYAPLFEVLDVVHFSVYPNMLKRLGGRERFDSLCEAVRALHPHLTINVNDKQSFRPLDFFEESVRPAVYCVNAECTALLPDGRMARCGAGGYLHLHPSPPRAFANSEDMFYDLNQFNQQSFWMWRKRFPLDACAHCSFAQPGNGSWKAQPGTPYRANLDAEAKARSAQRLLAMRRMDLALEEFEDILAKNPACGEARRGLEQTMRLVKSDALEVGRTL